MSMRRLLDTYEDDPQSHKQSTVSCNTRSIADRIYDWMVITKHRETSIGCV